MSASLWIMLFVVLVLCIIIFKKTVSSDAENDFKIRDILSSGDSLTEETKSGIQEENNHPGQPETDYTEPQKNIYEEIHEMQLNEQFKTNSHDENETEFINNNDTEPKYNNPDNERQSTAAFEKELKYDIKQDICVKKKTFFDYIKIFWRSITFTAGMLVCIYSIIGILHYIQTSNDAIVYSIWLLIGVILIK